MKNHSDSIIIEKVHTKYNLEALLELYRSWKHSPFSFNKKTMVIATVIWSSFFTYGLSTYSHSFIIIWVIISAFSLFYYWRIEWYREWSESWLRDWFDSGRVNGWLWLLLILFENKHAKKPSIEKIVTNRLLRYLNRKFEPFSSISKDNSNEAIAEFQLKKIIEQEIVNYESFNSTL